MTMADRILLMEGGAIVQDATPDALYDRPATVFAAGFLGSMNFMPVSYDAGPGTAAMGRAMVRVPREAVRGDVGPRAILGIRPEDVMLVEDGRNVVDPAEPNLLTAMVESLEFRGALYRLRLVAEEGASLEQALFADATARQVRRMGLGRGSRLRICLPLARLHLFPGTGDEAVTQRDAA